MMDYRWSNPTAVILHSVHLIFTSRPGHCPYTYNKIIELLPIGEAPHSCVFGQLLVKRTAGIGYRNDVAPFEGNSQDPPML
jgi:hypothetical protein